MNAPHPEDPRKPRSPKDLSGTSWRHVLRSSIREFSEDGLIDLGAGLTFFAVLSIFPAIVALVSIFNLMGQDPTMITGLLDELRGILPQDQMGMIESVVLGLIEPEGAGIGLVIGLLVALWSASNYVKAFGRAMNRIYDVEEGRPLVTYYLQMYLLTAMLLVGGAITAFLAVVSGPVARTLGALIGLGDQAVAAWSVAKWPVMGLVAMTVIALLYYFTPNVRQPRFRWISVGVVVALVVGGIASAGFAFYVANFGNYDATYGALAGVIIFLFWLWIINIVVLYGAELDSELERARQLQGGIEAEEELRLPPRDTRASDKLRERREADVERGRELREHAQELQAADAPFRRHDPAESPSGRRYGSSSVDSTT